MSRATPVQIAIIAQRMRAAGLTVEADTIQEHIDSMGSEDRAIDVLVQAARAQEATNVLLTAWKPTIDNSVAALSRLVAVEERRLKVEEQTHAADTARVALRYQHVIIPIVTALTGALVSWAAATWGH